MTIYEFLCEQANDLFCQHPTLRDEYHTYRETHVPSSSMELKLPINQIASVDEMLEDENATWIIYYELPVMLMQEVWDAALTADKTPRDCADEFLDAIKSYIES